MVLGARTGSDMYYSQHRCLKAEEVLALHTTVGVIGMSLVPVFTRIKPKVVQLLRFGVKGDLDS
jgi:hypothetical protein